jgi:hypothetical protein
VWWDDFLLEESPVLGTYFDGATAAAGDYTYAWSGTANASVSYQKAPVVTGVSEVPSLAHGYQSTTGSVAGTKALRITPVSSSIDTFAEMANMFAGYTFKPNTTYHISADCTLAAPLTGTLDLRARGFRAMFNGIETVFTYTSTKANTAGSSRVSATFTTPAVTTISFFRLMNGASAGNGDVWWDRILLVEGDGTDVNGYFDGSTPADEYFTYSWAGTPNASISRATP